MAQHQQLVNVSNGGQAVVAAKVSRGRSRGGRLQDESLVVASLLGMPAQLRVLHERTPNDWAHRRSDGAPLRSYLDAELAFFASNYNAAGTALDRSLERRPDGGLEYMTPAQSAEGGTSVVRVFESLGLAARVASLAGDLPRAAMLLAELGSYRNYACRGEPFAPVLWLQGQAALARTYDHLGKSESAAAVRQRLDRLLQRADPAFVRFVVHPD